KEEDLYHRLSVIVIKVPSLNDRKEDIPLLVEKFLNDTAEEQGIRKKNIQSKAVKTLQSHDWTGNVRELRNAVERLVILSAEEISADDVEKYL
ncbi:MAG: sigma-54-dependent Fis family transcriptional regulator, partial [Cyclobacteriaceae bacterium]|nr:sigma-54-dependent Fis family transcriptional regulator [Cyclobacteriaceae bacterium]